MDTESVMLTVFFEGPFWAGVFERTAGGKLSVCKVTFGAEPKDQEVWEFILKHYDYLKFVRRMVEANGGQSKTPAAQCQKAAASFRHRHQVPAGAANAAGGAENAEKANQQGAAVGREAAPI